jgi:hypothetical protein
MPHAQEVLAEIGAGLQRCVGEVARRAHVTPVCMRNAQAHESDRFYQFVVGRLALGRHGAEFCDCSGQIAPHQVRHRKMHATRPCREPVTDGLRENMSLFGGRLRCDWVT